MHRQWTQNYLEWIKREVSFDQRPQQMKLEDYLNEVDHSAVRIERLEKAIDEAVEQAPESMRELIRALQALRGVAKVGVVTIVAELGTLTRFEHPRQLMGYSGAVSSERSSGGKIRRGGITKTGNAHLQRIIVEVAWSQRYKPPPGSAPGLLLFPGIEYTFSSKLILGLICLFRSFDWPYICYLKLFVDLSTFS